MINRLHLPSRPAFLLLEVLIGVTVFGLFVAAVGFVLLNGQEGTIAAGDRIRAVYLTERAIEGVRAVRDTDFDDLTEGQHGVALSDLGVWSLTGSSITTSGGYTTFVTISSINDDLVRVAAETKWKHGYSRSGSVLITTDIADWRSSTSIGDWGSISLEGSYTDAGTPLFNHGALHGDYLFVTSETSDGGAGLYVFDVSTPTAPTRVASSFSLGSAGHGIGIIGDRLYVATEDSTAEVQVYDVSNPSSFSSSDLVATYNMDGTGRARALAIDGTTVYVTAVESATIDEDEFYALDASSSGAITLFDSIDATETFAGIGLSGTSALLASSNNGGELRAANIANPAVLQLPTSEVINATDVQDGYTVAATGTAAFLGRESGEAIEELVRYTLATGGGIAPTQASLYHEIGGSVFELTVEPTGCYLFLASDAPTKELQIINAQSQTLAEESYYDLSTGAARGVLYNMGINRAFVFTNTAIHIFTSAAGVSSCS